MLFIRLLTKIPKYQASIDVMVFFFKKNKPKGKNSVVLRGFIPLLMLLFSYFERNKTAKRTTVLWLFLYIVHTCIRDFV